MANRICDKLRGVLEPHYDELDGLIDEIVNSSRVSELQAKYFEACRFKVKALWHISKRIEAFDSQYREYLSICTGKGELEQMQLSLQEKLFFVNLL